MKKKNRKMSKSERSQMREVLIIMIVSCVGAREKMMRVVREFEGKKTTSLSSSIIGTTT